MATDATARALRALKAKRRGAPGDVDGPPAPRPAGIDARAAEEGSRPARGAAGASTSSAGDGADGPVRMRMVPETKTVIVWECQVRASADPSIARSRARPPSDGARGRKVRAAPRRRRGATPPARRS